MWPDALNQPNRHEKTPFHFACEWGNMTMVQIFSQCNNNCCSCLDRQVEKNESSTTFSGYNPYQRSR
jgi:hypothetical protein